MTVINKPITSIIPYKNNPRNNDNAVSFVKESIREFGFKVPIVIDRNNIIVCGHTRFKAAIELEMSEVPCVLIDDLTEKQIREYRIADNSTAEIAIWDKVLLSKELEQFNSESASTPEINLGEIDLSGISTEISEQEENVEFQIIFNDKTSKDRFNAFMNTLKKENPDLTKGEALLLVLEKELYE